MKRFTKLAAWLLILVLSLSFITGCQKNEEASGGDAVVSTQESDKPEETIVLKWWGGVPPEYGFQAVADAFNEEYADKGIQIEYTRYVNDEAGNLQLETNLLAGEGVDVYFSYGLQTVGKRANAGFALELTDLIKRDEYDLPSLFGESVVANYIDGKPYSVPTTIGNNCMLVNKTMFDEAGIALPTSWTWDEYRAIAKKLTKGEGQDKVYGAFMDNNWLPGIMERTLSSVGTDGYYKPDGQSSNFDDERFLKSLSTAVEMMHMDESTPLYSDVITQKLRPDAMFLSEKTAMVSTEWIFRYIKDLESNPHDFITAAVPFPVYDKSATFYQQGGNLDDLVINPKSKHVDAAWEFVKWYADGGMLPVAEFGRIPGNKNVDSDAVNELFFGEVSHLFDVDSFNRHMLGAKELYWKKTINTALPEIVQILGEEVEAAYMQQKTPEEALKALKERADAKIEKELK